MQVPVLSRARRSVRSGGGTGSLWYDGAIMMARTQITLTPEIQRRARQRAADLGISLAEYVRRVVERDLGGVPAQADPALVFDLGRSGGSDIAKHKDAMIADAIASSGSRRRRLRA